MEKDYDSIIDQIRKVKELSERGVDGEKETAKAMLDKLLKKHNVSLEELLVVDRKEYKFKFKTEHDKKILFQCLAKFAPSITHFKTHVTNRGVSKNVITVELTKMEFLDVEASAKFYNKLYAKELELFYYAFLSKHNIFREKTEDDSENESKLSDEEVLAIIAMMRGMRDEKFISTKKQIESPK